MKAVIFSQHGGPEVLRLAEMPEPSIGDRDVLVRRARLRFESPRSVGAWGLARAQRSAAAYSRKRHFG